MVGMSMADWQTLSGRINSVDPSATLAVDTKAKAMKAQGVDVIGFGAGEPDFPTPDFIAQAASRACLDPRNHRYTPTAGLPELRQAIADKTRRDSGYEVDPDQVVVTNGGKQAVYETFQVLLNPGDQVIIPTPYWTSYPAMVTLAGAQPVPVLSGADQGYMPSLDALEEARTDQTKAIIINTPSNPTGVVWGDELVRAINQWALDHHIWVISDEIYEHLTYEGAHTPYPGKLTPDIRGQLVVLNGVAKTFAMTGWRVGWMVAPVQVAQAASKLQGHISSNVADVCQRAALAALEGPWDQMEAMRQAFDIRRKTILTELNAIPGMTCPEPRGAFYAFPDVGGLLGRPIGPKGTVCQTSSDLAEAILEEIHVAAVPGEAFGAPGHLRFSYALADKDLAEGMHRIQEWVRC